jgi:methionine biosynthesis protein MetW|tara:strand:- start:165 stop:779 length:615 start_codon:yes stop_codon:yes gene_type:complete
MGNHQIFLENKFKKVAELIRENSKVLDIGCNNGMFRRFIPNCKYYGVDIDKNLVNKLIKKNIKAKQADLNKNEIPFKNQKFDYILLLDILEHVIDSKKLLIESKKRLNESGKIIITLPNDYHLLNKVRFLFNRSITENPFDPYGHLHYFSIKTGERFLINSGFKVLKKDYIASTNPSFLPQVFKNFLAKIFPQSFARDILYILS